MKDYAGAARKAYTESRNETGQTLEQRAAEKLFDLKAAKLAKEWQTREEAGVKPAPWSKSLAELLAETDDMPTYRIGGLWPTGGNIVFSAQYKTGKTTLVGNVLRCLADGDPFLGMPNSKFATVGLSQFPVRALGPGQTVFLADIELDERTIRRWLRDQGIYNQDRVRTRSLRGKLDEFDILNPDRRGEWVRVLRSWAVKVLIIDPIGPLLAAYGFSENSNEDLAKVFAAIDALTTQAGIEETMLVHHMGHNGERSRGGSVFRGWPDAEWRLLREEVKPGHQPPPDGPRFFSAEGRDVALHETQLAYDHQYRALTVAGGNRKQHAANRHMPAVLQTLKDNPGLGRNELVKACQNADVPQGAARDSIKTLVESGKAHTYPGPRNAQWHVFSDECGQPAKCELARKEAESRQ
jgi:AAA domain